MAERKMTLDDITPEEREVLYEATGMTAEQWAWVNVRAAIRYLLGYETDEIDYTEQ